MRSLLHIALVAFLAHVGECQVTGALQVEERAQQPYQQEQPLAAEQGLLPPYESLISRTENQERSLVAPETEQRQFAPQGYGDASQVRPDPRPFTEQPQDLKKPNLRPVFINNLFSGQKIIEQILEGKE